MGREPATARDEDGPVVIRVRVSATGRFAGTVDEEGAEAPRDFDGWVEFMGAIAELRERGERPAGAG